TLLEPDAVEFLLAQNDPVGCVEALLETRPEAPFVLTLHDVQGAREIGRQAATRLAVWPAAEPVSPSPLVTASFRRSGEEAADREPDVRILRDITGRSTCEGTLADFTRYFRHRFHVLRNMVRARRELGGAQDIAKARRSTREVGIIGMVADVRTTKNGHRVFEIEDDTDQIAVLLPADSGLAAEPVVLDEVVVIGDGVDGIGVYPRQDEELAIEDIYGQYEALARMIAALPDRLTVIMLPGNHDAVRPAEPQPAFPTSIQKLFDSNVIFAGN